MTYRLRLQVGRGIDVVTVEAEAWKVTDRGFSFYKGANQTDENFLRFFPLHSVIDMERISP